MNHQLPPQPLLLYLSGGGPNLSLYNETPLPAIGIIGASSNSYPHLSRYFPKDLQISSQPVGHFSR